MVEAVSFAFPVYICVYVCMCVQILKDTLSNLYREGVDKPEYRLVHTYVLNPKVLTHTQ